MRAVRVEGALECPNCCRVIDPDQYHTPVEVDTWRCTDCGYVSDDGPDDVAKCKHDPPEVVKEYCDNCSTWQDPQDFRKRKQCPLCDNWLDPVYDDFEESYEVYRCSECETVHQDRDDAMECCT